MFQRVSLVAFALLAAGCSQRAPWRVVPGPAPAANPRHTVTGAAHDRESEPSIALSAVAAVESAAPEALLLPVLGADPARLEDSFDTAREGGRKHNAIDILAPRGTPVLSVQDGRILRLSKNSNGGITIYAADLESHFVFYYAHLDRYHGNVYAGRPLLRGDTLGYVGTSGNAPKDTPHLHFQVMRMPADGKFWNGEPINPYPLLRQITPVDR
jgi:murein DD-endopeptidase MepM/ murein hydrolase activator NlpD